MKRMRMMRISNSTKRVLYSLGIVLFAFLVFIVPITVTYAKSMDQMIPEEGDSKAIYNLYPSDHYAFQTASPDRHFWQIGDQANDGITRMYDHMLSGGFYVGIQITRFFNFVAREAFQFTYMNDLIKAAEEIIQNVTGVKGGFIGTGLWGSGILGLLSTTALIVVLWQMLRLRFLDSLQTMATFLLAFVIALGFFSQAGTFLRLVNDAGNELGDMMYKGMATAGGLKPSETDGIGSISEQVWMELVMKPYGMLQFDDANAYEKNFKIVDEVLKTDPFSDERDKALKKYTEPYPAVSQVRSDEQMIILLCNSIFAAFILGLFCFWSVLTIYMRLKFLIHACAMSITLLASLLPGREAGISVIRSQFIKLIGLVMQIVFTMFFLDLSLVLGHKVYQISSPSGWFTGMLLEAIVVFVVFKYREEIGSVFSKAAGQIPMTPRAKSSLLDETQRWGTRKLMASATGAISGMFNRKEQEGVPSTFNPSAISKAGDNLNDATTASMQLRYQREKEAAEQHAVETGQPVQYTPYVQKVNENLRNNTKNPFRGMDKDWKEEKTRLGDIQKDGGDVKQAILTQSVNEGMSDQQVAATMYANENAIRQASTFMVNRPKSAVKQMQRAGTLNKNRKLETSVNDFVMVELFTRYKVENKQANDRAAATGEPMKPTDFVKSMDERFKAAGLNTTQKVNDVMLTRSGRVSVASKFESLPEFGKKRDDLLSANEAFRKATVPQEGIPAPVVPVNTIGPINGAAVLKNMPAVSTVTVKREFPIVLVDRAEVNSNIDTSMTNPVTLKREIPIVVTGQAEVKTNIEMSKVKLPDDLKATMKDRTERLKDGSGLDIGDHFTVDSKTNVTTIHRLKTTVKQETSEELHSLDDHLKVMREAKGSRVQAATTSDHDKIVLKNAKNAQQTRQVKSRAKVE